MSETIYANCSICGNKSGYDKQSLKASTLNINGVDIVLDCHCEDELFHKIAKRRGIEFEYGDLDEDTEFSGEIVGIKITDKSIKVKQDG